MTSYNESNQQTNFLLITGLPGAGKSTLVNNLRGLTLNLDPYGVKSGDLWVTNLDALDDELKSIRLGSTVIVEGTSDNLPGVVTSLKLFGEVSVFLLDATNDELRRAWTNRCKDGKNLFSKEFCRMANFDSIEMLDWRQQWEENILKHMQYKRLIRSTAKRHLINVLQRLKG